MVYKKDFIYNIYWVTHLTDGVTDDIVWILGTRMPWFNTKLGFEKSIHHIYVLYILYVIYIVYILYAYYIYIYCIHM